jgi:hypothetical protein
MLISDNIIFGFFKVVECTILRHGYAKSEGQSDNCIPGTGRDISRSGRKEFIA